MTEDVLVSVKGLHTLDRREEDEIEIFSVGKYYFKNGKHYILYEETVQEDGSIIKNRITMKDGRMEVHKSGALTARMVFERSKKNNSWYHTPAGSVLAGIEVQSMKAKQQDDLLEITVDYTLEMNYEKVADCKIRIRVMEKNSSAFHLC